MACRLLGKPALIEQSASGLLTYTRRPVFCHVMKDAVLVFTGFRKKSEVVSNLYGCMSPCLVKEETSYLILYAFKYKEARSLRL